MLAATAAPAFETGPEVTFAMRLEVTRRSPVAIRVNLPEEALREGLPLPEVRARGLKWRLERDPEPHVLLTGSPDRSLRLAVRAALPPLSDPLEEVPPPLAQPPPPGPDDLPYLLPAPLFPSRSILVREFLETAVGPRLSEGSGNLVREIFAAVRRSIRADRRGPTLPLDVLRQRRGRRLGRERVLVTALRCAGVPARLVEGIDLALPTRRKRVFWTEARIGGRWWPMSASRGWYGMLPRTVVALARDGKRPIRVEGAARLTYQVIVRNRKGDDDSS